METFIISAAGKSTISKDPNATLDYTFDWTDWLLLVADTIVSQVSSVENSADSGVTISFSEITDANRKVVVWLSGGTVGKTATVRTRITTNSSPPRVDDRTIYVKIKER